MQSFSVLGGTKNVKASCRVETLLGFHHFLKQQQLKLDMQFHHITGVTVHLRVAVLTAVG